MELFYGQLCSSISLILRDMALPTFVNIRAITSLPLEVSSHVFSLRMLYSQLCALLDV